MHQVKTIAGLASIDGLVIPGGESTTIKIVTMERSKYAVYSMLCVIGLTFRIYFPPGPGMATSWTGTSDPGVPELFILEHSCWVSFFPFSS